MEPELEVAACQLEDPRGCVKIHETIHLLLVLPVFLSLVNPKSMSCARCQSIALIVSVQYKHASTSYLATPNLIPCINVSTNQSTGSLS